MLRITALALLLLHSACGGSPAPRPHPTPAQQTAASWRATAIFAVRAWAAGEVPRPFVRRTLATAARDLATSPAMRPSDTLVQRLQDAVEAGNRGAALRLVADLERASASATAPPRRGAPAGASR